MRRNIAIQWFATASLVLATHSASAQVLIRGRSQVVIAVPNGITDVGELDILVDSDSDGTPDAWEVANGLDPMNAADADEDIDGDGLSAFEEYLNGTDPNVADSDGDGFSDLEEVLAGTSPTSAASRPDAPVAELVGLQVSPTTSRLTVNTALGVARQQLTVTGVLEDGSLTDLTSQATGTVYSAVNEAVAQVTPSGEVVATSLSNPGTTSITVSNRGLTAGMSVTVRVFRPTPVGAIDTPGYAYDVAVGGNTAWVADGGAGLTAIDVTDKRAPVLVSTTNTGSTVYEAVVVGNRAYLATSHGLEIADISDPHSVTVLGRAVHSGSQGVAVVGSVAYVVGAPGLAAFDVSDPAAPTQLSALGIGGGPTGVGATGNRVAVASSSGVTVVDASTPSALLLVGVIATPPARKLAVSGGLAFVAASFLSSGRAGIVTVDLVNLRELGRSDIQLNALDVALGIRDLLFAADNYFVNNLPIFRVTLAAAPQYVAEIPFRNGPFVRWDADGTGVFALRNYVYNTVGGDGLQIGQFLEFNDNGVTAPTVRISAPGAGTVAKRGALVDVSIDATDDVMVKEVRLVVDGALVATFEGEGPHIVRGVELPCTGDGVVLRAEAVDFADNTGSFERPIVLEAGLTERLCSTGLIGACGLGLLTCEGDVLVCSSEVLVAQEICNNVDDDCDGIIDEGNPGGGGACDTGEPGVCTEGTLQCLSYSPADVLDYTFNSNGAATDLSGNNNHGTVVEATAIAGRYGDALAFDGVNDHVYTPDSPSLTLGSQLTAESWANPSTTSSFRDVIGQTAPPWPTGSAWILRTTQGGNGQFTPHLATSGGGYGMGCGAVSTGAWTHLAMTYNGGTFAGHTGGIERCSSGASGTVNDPATDVLVGKNLFDGVVYFAGRIDDSKVWRSARTATELGSDLANDSASHGELLCSPITEASAEGAFASTTWHDLGDTGFLYLEKDDRTYFNSNSCASKFLPPSATYAGIRFTTGPGTGPNGTEGSLFSSGQTTTLTMPVDGMKATALHLLVPGGRCGARSHYITWNYADGTTASGTRTLAHDCGVTGNGCDGTSCTTHLGGYGPYGCCDQWYVLRWVNTRPTAGVRSVSLRADCGCDCGGSGGSTQETWAVTLQVPNADYVALSSGANSCDDLDNDCDGLIDEPRGEACDTGGEGACGVGTYVCDASGDVVCVATSEVGPEVCDAVDNDCDGSVDEDNPDGGDACDTGQLGVCAAGTLTCGEPCSATNISLSSTGTTAAATTSYPNPAYVPAKLIDGVKSGGYAAGWLSADSAGFPILLTLTLPGPRTVTGVTLTQTDSAAYTTRDYQVQLSTDGTTFTTVAQNTLPQINAHSQDNPITATVARAVRVVITSGYRPNGYDSAGLAELEVHGCTSTTVGQLVCVRDTAPSRELEGTGEDENCNGLIDEPALCGTSSVDAALSCRTIKEDCGTTTSGTYWIDPDQDGTGFEVYCDMVLHGGGWALIGKLGEGAGGSSAFDSDVSLSTLSAGPVPTSGEYSHFDMARFAAYGTSWTVRSATDAYNNQTHFQYAFYRPRATATITPTIAGRNWNGTNTYQQLRHLTMSTTTGLTNTTWLDVPECGGGHCGCGVNLWTYRLGNLGGDCLGGDGETAICHSVQGGVSCGAGTMTTAFGMRDGVGHTWGRKGTYWIKDVSRDGSPNTP